MNVIYSQDFLADVELQRKWYEGEVNAALGLRYGRAVLTTVKLRAANPNLGMRCRYRSPKLGGLRRYFVARPFRAHMVFYRIKALGLEAVRVMSGRRDLPRRLLEPPGAN